MVINISVDLLLYHLNVRSIKKITATLPDGILQDAFSLASKQAMTNNLFKRV